MLDGRPQGRVPVDLAEYGFTEAVLAERGLSTAGPAPDPELALEARRILHEYELAEAGVSYQAQGYHTGDGVTVWARKVDEHWLCHVLVAEAIEQRKPKKG